MPSDVSVGLACWSLQLRLRTDRLQSQALSSKDSVPTLDRWSVMDPDCGRVAVVECVLIDSRPQLIGEVPCRVHGLCSE